MTDLNITHFQKITSCTLNSLCSARKYITTGSLTLLLLVTFSLDSAAQAEPNYHTLSRTIVTSTLSYYTVSEEVMQDLVLAH